MKRTVGALLLALGLTLGLVVPQVAHAAPKPKDCAIVTFAEGGYNTLNGVPTAAVAYDLRAPACKNVDYVLAATTTTGALIQSVTAPYEPTSAGRSLVLPLSGGPTTICLSLDTLSGMKLVDHVPTNGSGACASGTEFTLDGGTGGQTMR